MNQRKAKMMAYLHISMILGSARNEGWPMQSEWFERLNDQDQKRVESAIAEIFQYLEYRAVVLPQICAVCGRQPVEEGKTCCQKCLREAVCTLDRRQQPLFKHDESSFVKGQPY